MTDDGTLGGYLRDHQRPPAFGGPDGRAYSVGVMVDDAADGDGRFGGALVFVRWSEAGDAPDGHVETPYLVRAETRMAVRRELHALSLRDVKARLDEAVAARQEVPDW